MGKRVRTADTAPLTTNGHLECRACPGPGPRGPLPRAEDEAHSLLAEAFSASADMEVIADQLHVRLEALSAPRRSRAIAALCADLNETETPLPLARHRAALGLQRQRPPRLTPPAVGNRPIPARGHSAGQHQPRRCTGGTTAHGQGGNQRLAHQRIGIAVEVQQRGRGDLFADPAILT